MSGSNDNDEMKHRTALETAERVLALLAVIAMVHSPDQVIAWMQENNIEPYLSADEHVFIHDESPTQELRVAFSWRAEALVSLIWSLQGIAEMPPFDAQFCVSDNELVQSAIGDPTAFIAGARLRSLEEIDNMEGHLFHQHWRVRDAELFGIGNRLDPSPDDPPLDELDHGIVYERRYALSWLVGWGDSWDDVPTDT